MGQPDIEQERIRELSKFVIPRPAIEISTHTSPISTDTIDTPSPRLSNDTTLTALTQLGVYRFGCNRSFVSIIDGESQHIISEATASISLRNEDHHRPDDGIFLGVNTLDLEWGVCPHAIRLFTGQDPSQIRDTENITANQTRNIIRDFTKEDFYKDRSYVLDWPFFRFYAEVPLYSPSGFVLGSYCVVDNKPRTEFGDEDVAALREIADSISNHLENARIVQYHRRSENLVKGLTNFVKSHSKFDPTSSSTRGQLEASAKKLNYEDLGLIATTGDVDGTLDSLPTEKDIGVYSPLDQRSSTSLNGKEASIFSLNKPSASNYTLPSSVSRTSDRAEPLASSVEGPPESLVPDNVPITERIAAIFARASILLKESLDLDGVVFLDAHRNDPQFEPSARHDDWHSLQNFERSSPAASRSGPWGLPNANSRKDAENYCGSLGQAISCRPAKSNTASKCQIEVTEELLHSLITNFPDGHIFNIDNRSNLASSVDSESSKPEISASNLEIVRQISHHVAQQLPEAKCVLFYPLWDWSKARWLAGTLVWVNGSHRPLGTEDLHYFKAFGDSMISEVSRIHWTASENSKFDFVTSISHELRSPLHGILASAELLNDIPLQSAQRDMVNMISTSGLTLLDTIDQLLDYCKINNLATTQSLSVANTEDSGTTLVSDFNLDSLVEQVAVILHAGRKSHGSVSSLAKDTAIATPCFQPASRVARNEDELSVIVNIEQSGSWNIRSVSGAWRRIVMNLLGNAMKWTQTGLIEVSLSQVAAQTQAEPHLVHLRVKDTGQGISQDFLKNSAFSPFAQEDSLSEGVGLGLSVVHKLVTCLGGDLKMKSESGVGTQVDVYIPAQRPEGHLSAKPSDGASAGIQRHQDTLKACLIGFNGYPDLTETPTGILSSDAKRKLSIQSTLANVFRVQLGWHVALAESLDKGDGDIAVIEEAKFTAMLNDQSPSATNTGHHFKFFIVLGSTTSSPDYSLPPNAILMSQPYGPQKICEAAQRIIDLHNSQAQIGGLEAVVLDTPTNLEILPSKSTVPSPPEIPKGFSQQPPVELVCPNPLIVGSPIRSNDQMNDMHVLIVDDNDINLKILATFMRKLGCSYDTASNGLIALEHVENSSRRYDLILMDLSMPVMDGLVSTSKIRQHEKDHNLQPSRIMAVTGVASDTMQQAAVTAGVNEYLVKPLSLRTLKKLIEPTL
ncbi:CheY-like superfamily [Penicillium italicum]|uniref:CheY-like superfamily n=1 Tax=Penicillium italicum TaxID=40296 RepID=A0A0A2L5G1_PENIT|nr:CheY-like superfamily [Penicillium italicum]